MIPFPSIYNGRGFFSEYWLGTLKSARKRGEETRLSSAQARNLLRRLIQLRQRVDLPDPLGLHEFRERFARPLLQELFGYRLCEGEEGVPVRNLLPIAAGVDGEQAAVVVLFVPDPEEIDSRGTRTRIDSALLEQGSPYGFILTPCVLRLVRRPGEGPRNAFLDFSLVSAAETGDSESLALAWSLLQAGNFVPAPDGSRKIDRLEEESRRHATRVSNDLKAAVFRSAEILIEGFLNNIRERGEHPDTAILSDLRDAALQMLYRLLFIFYAESRDERLQTHTLYLESYSLERLVGRLIRTPFSTIPYNRFGYWEHLQALFRIYDQGLPALPGLQNIPPRGGTLFSETTREGSLLASLRLPDRAVAELLLNLGCTRPRRGVGRERVSFRELAIEHLGSVYEGLLEYEPRIADDLRIEVRVQGKDFVLSPEEITRLCEQKELTLVGDPSIVEGTSVAALHPELVDGEPDEEEETAEGEPDAAEVEGEEEEDEKGVKKGGNARLIRRLDQGRFHFVPGKARKSSGSYYTPESIVEYLVKEALDPLTEGRTASEIEDLRIIDPACGSAHFLVGAARFLGRKLFAAYRAERAQDPAPEFHPGRELTDGVRAEWEHEGEAWCKRRIVERCLYGVDLNPMAVQLAQVALWIESLAGDRPLSFFDHHVRLGNSLLGTWLATFSEPALPGYGVAPGMRGLFEAQVEQAIRETFEERQLIDAPLPPEIKKDTPAEYEYKNDRFLSAERKSAAARLLFDLRNALPFLPMVAGEWETILTVENPEGFCMGRPWWQEFEIVRQQQRFFHWELEYPEIFFSGRRGFDAVLGNPPWDKIKPDRKEFYSRFDILIRAYSGGELDTRIRELHAENPGLSDEFESYSKRIRTIAACLKRGPDYHHVDWEIDGRSTGGDPDLFRFFLERVHWILHPGGHLGYLVPGALYSAEGCTGLRHLLLDSSRVTSFFGFENRKKVFNIHSSYKFVCLGLEKLIAGPDDGTYPPGSGEFRAVYMRHEESELREGPPPGTTVMVRRAEVVRLSPGTLAFPEYRDEQDRDIVLRMYGIGDGRKPRPLIGDSGPNSWGARYCTQYHLTNDRALWTREDGRLYTPKNVCGLDWPSDLSLPFTEIREAMASRGFWPLYEGKSIEQFLVDIKPVERWVSLEKVTAKYGSPPNPEPKLVFRDIARNTDEKTFIAAVLPERSCAGNTLGILSGLALPLDQAASILNSLPIDYTTRLKTSGTHLNWTYVSRVVAPSIFEARRIPILPTRSVSGTGISSIADDSDFFEALWLLNRAVAEAFGLSAEDFAHIFASFPVMVRKRPALTKYFRDRISEWRSER